jgi:hypothetical protein
MVYYGGRTCTVQARSVVARAASHSRGARTRVLGKAFDTAYDTIAASLQEWLRSRAPLRSTRSGRPAPSSHHDEVDQRSHRRSAHNMVRRRLRCAGTANVRSSPCGAAAPGSGLLRPRVSPHGPGAAKTGGGSAMRSTGRIETRGGASPRSPATLSSRSLMRPGINWSTCFGTGSGKLRHPRRPEPSSSGCFWRRSGRTLPDPGPARPHRAVASSGDGRRLRARPDGKGRRGTVPQPGNPAADSAYDRAPAPPITMARRRLPASGWAHGPGIPRTGEGK